MNEIIKGVWLNSIQNELDMSGYGLYLRLAVSLLLTLKLHGTLVAGRLSNIISELAERNRGVKAHNVPVV